MTSSRAPGRPPEPESHVGDQDHRQTLGREHMAPWGGVETLLITNPIAIAVPAAEYSPVVLDMATTVVAYGKVKTKVARGEPIPEGWMIDRLGAAVGGQNLRHEHGGLIRCR